MLVSSVDNMNILDFFFVLLNIEWYISTLYPNRQITLRIMLLIFN